MKAGRTLDAVLAYRRLFLTEDGSGLTEDARVFFADLGAACGWSRPEVRRDRQGRVDAADAVAQVARLGVYQHINERLSADVEELKAAAADERAAMEG